MVGKTLGGLIGRKGWKVYEVASNRKRSRPGPWLPRPQTKERTVGCSQGLDLNHRFHSRFDST